MARRTDLSEWRDRYDEWKAKRDSASRKKLGECEANLRYRDFLIAQERKLADRESEMRSRREKFKILEPWRKKE
jgi:hypothetical protein